MLTRDASCHNVHESNMIQMSSQGLHCTAICYISVDNVHGFCPQCTWTNSMDIVHGTFPWTLSMELFHGHCPWILSTDSLDNLHGLWKKSMNSMEKFHGHTGKIPRTYWKNSLDIFHGFTGNCPLFSFQYSSRTMSIDSMDFVH